MSESLFVVPSSSTPASSLSVPSSSSSALPTSSTKTSTTDTDSVVVEWRSFNMKFSHHPQIYQMTLQWLDRFLQQYCKATHRQVTASSKEMEIQSIVTIAETKASNRQEWLIHLFQYLYDSYFPPFPSSSSASSSSSPTSSHPWSSSSSPSSSSFLLWSTIESRKYLRIRLDSFISLWKSFCPKLNEETNAFTDLLTDYRLKYKAKIQQIRAIYASENSCLLSRELIVLGNALDTMNKAVLAIKRLLRTFLRPSSSSTTNPSNSGEQKKKKSGYEGMTLRHIWQDMAIVHEMVILRPVVKIPDERLDGLCLEPTTAATTSTAKPNATPTATTSTANVNNVSKAGHSHNESVLSPVKTPLATVTIAQSNTTTQGEDILHGSSSKKAKRDHDSDNNNREMIVIDLTVDTVILSDHDANDRTREVDEVHQTEGNDEDDDDEVVILEEEEAKMYESSPRKRKRGRPRKQRGSSSMSMDLEDIETVDDLVHETIDATALEPDIGTVNEVSKFTPTNAVNVIDSETMMVDEVGKVTSEVAEDIVIERGNQNGADIVTEAERVKENDNENAVNSIATELPTKPSMIEPELETEMHVESEEPIVEAEVVLHVHAEVVVETIGTAIHVGTEIEAVVADPQTGKHVETGTEAVEERDINPLDSSTTLPGNHVETDNMEIEQPIDADTDMSSLEQQQKQKIDSKLSQVLTDSKYLLQLLLQPPQPPSQSQSLVPSESGSPRPVLPLPLPLPLSPSLSQAEQEETMEIEEKQKKFDEEHVAEEEDDDSDDEDCVVITTLSPKQSLGLNNSGRQSIGVVDSNGITGMEFKSPLFAPLNSGKSQSPSLSQVAPQLQSEEFVEPTPGATEAPLADDGNPVVAETDSSNALGVDVVDDHDDIIASEQEEAEPHPVANNSLSLCLSPLITDLKQSLLRTQDKIATLNNQDIYDCDDDDTISRLQRAWWNVESLCKELEDMREKKKRVESDESKETKRDKHKKKKHKKEREYQEEKETKREGEKEKTDKKEKESKKERKERKKEKEHEKKRERERERGNDQDKESYDRDVLTKITKREKEGKHVEGRGNERARDYREKEGKSQTQIAVTNDFAEFNGDSDDDCVAITTLSQSTPIPMLPQPLPSKKEEKEREHCREGTVLSTSVPRVNHPNHSENYHY